MSRCLTPLDLVPRSTTDYSTLSSFGLPSTTLPSRYLFGTAARIISHALTISGENL